MYMYVKRLSMPASSHMQAAEELMWAANVRYMYYMYYMYLLLLYSQSLAIHYE